MITLAPDEQKRLGAFYTPRSLADYLVRWAVRTPADRVLDPACGEAVFLASVAARLSELGQTALPDQVVGFEIDSRAAHHAQDAVPVARVVQGDFFFQPAKWRWFDAVVGNPPYIRYHYFSGPVRERALALSRQEGVTLTQLTSSWAPFVIHASTFLKDSGRLAFVLPAELLSTDYAAPVRQYLTKRFASVTILAFEERVFPGAMVDAVVLLAEGKGPGEVRVRRLRNLESLASLETGRAQVVSTTKWTDAFVEPGALAALERVSATMRPLGAIARVDIGVVTGANGFFVMSDGEARQRGLSAADLLPIVARGTQLTSYALSPEQWDHVRSRNEDVWLFAPRDDSGAAGDYIRYGERQHVHEAYKCRVRNPWWRIKVPPKPPDLILSYMSNRAPRLVANDAGVRTTNLLHNVTLMSHDEVAELIALAWTNSATLLTSELRGRAYGGGVLKLETREAERVVIPKLSADVSRELRSRADDIGRLLRDARLEDVADIVDRVVLSAFDGQTRTLLRHAWLDLRSRRRRRAAPAVSDAQTRWTEAGL